MSNSKNSNSTFLEKNQKALIGVGIALILVVIGFFSYKEFILAPKQEKASAALFNAERWFQDQSYEFVLNGDGQSAGALSIINRFGGTDAANLAHYYAGMSYLQTGDATNAIKHLESFKGKKTPFQYLAQGAIGDAQMELGNVDKAINHYKKAAQNEHDHFTSALFLFRAGLASETNGKLEDAKNLYQEIKTKYPQSIQARDIEKYLARVGHVDN